MAGVKVLSSIGRFFKNKWKLLVCLLAVALLVIGGILGYDYYKNTYIPEKRLNEAIQDIEKMDKQLADMLTPVFNKIGLGKRRGGREYNEILVSQRKFQGIFAYDRKYEDIPLWMRKYAQDNDLLMVIFGKDED
jgi:hypothetical protein